MSSSTATVVVDVDPVIDGPQLPTGPESSLNPAAAGTSEPATQQLPAGNSEHGIAMTVVSSAAMTSSTSADGKFREDVTAGPIDMKMMDEKKQMVPVAVPQQLRMLKEEMNVTTDLARLIAVRTL